MIAETLQKALDAEIERIIDTKKRSGIIGWFKSGYDAMKEKLAEIKPLEHNLDQYDLILLGTPVWASKMTPAIRTVLNEQKENLSKIAFFCTAGGEDNAEMFQEMADICGKKPIATLEISRKEIKKQLYTSKINTFLQEIHSSRSQS